MTHNKHTPHHNPPPPNATNSTRILYLTTPKYDATKDIYMDGSFIPPKGKGNGNMAGFGIYILINNMKIVERLPKFQNILRKLEYMPFG